MCVCVCACVCVRGILYHVYILFFRLLCIFVGLTEFVMSGVLVDEIPRHENDHRIIQPESTVLVLSCPPSSHFVSSLSAFPSCVSLTGIIGVKHVKPDHVYKFDFEATEEQYDVDQIGRNITLIKGLVHDSLAVHDNRCGLPCRSGMGCIEYPPVVQ